MKNIKNLWKYIRNGAGITGLLLMLGGISTSDYHIIEMGQTEPSTLWIQMLIGLLLMVPAAVHLIRTEMKGERENVFYKNR